MATRPIAPQAAAYAVAVAVLCGPALWNGFPLMFDDVGGYLERWPTASLGIGRSTVYGGLLWATRAAAFAPVILLQALVTVFVIDHALAVLGPVGRPSWLLPAVVAAIAAVSGAAFFVSQAIPDAWAAPGVLALHLVAWHADRFTRAERVALATIVAVAGACHMATFGVLAGMWLLYGLAWLTRRRLDPAPNGIGAATVAVWSGLVLLVVANGVVAGRFGLTPGGEMFLFGRMIEDGMAAEILAEECPRPDWQLCDYREALPEYEEAFIFDADGPLRKIGGWQDPRARAEVAAIIARSIARHPVAHARRAVALTAQQFVDVGTGGAMDPLMSWHTRWILTRDAPGLVAGFDAARQQTGGIDLTAWSEWIVVPLTLGASFGLPLITVLLWRNGRRRAAMLPAAVFLALLGNAAICGIVVGSNDRYQSRLAWLATLAIGLSAPALARRATMPISAAARPPRTSRLADRGTARSASRPELHADP